MLYRSRHVNDVRISLLPASRPGPDPAAPGPSPTGGNPGPPRPAASSTTPASASSIRYAGYLMTVRNWCHSTQSSRQLVALSGSASRLDPYGTRLRHASIWSVRTLCRQRPATPVRGSSTWCSTVSYRAVPPSRTEANRSSPAGTEDDVVSTRRGETCGSDPPSDRGPAAHRGEYRLDRLTISHGGRSHARSPSVPIGGIPPPPPKSMRCSPPSAGGATSTTDLNSASTPGAYFRSQFILCTSLGPVPGGLSLIPRGLISSSAPRTHASSATSLDAILGAPFPPHSLWRNTRPHSTVFRSVYGSPGGKPTIKHHGTSASSSPRNPLQNDSSWAGGLLMLSKGGTHAASFPKWYVPPDVARLTSR
mmetsp:Transcript_31333/g.74756  ORF Transcript_31333/g.74756 Transcript_31333/m.74756 type:complete len:364 (+) Transcript_31333:213-1304(+)